MLQITGCAFDKSSIFALLSLAEFKTFSFLGSLVTGGDLISLKDVRCDSFQSIVSFAFVNFGSTNESIWSLFDKRDSFENMAEISITNTHWLDLPENLSSIFPNLQTLDLPNNGLQVPHSNFPWTQDTVYLPNNLSRTGYMHQHYADSQSLSIPTDIFRRSMDMKKNNITDLSMFEFHGLIHMISLQNNSLRSLGENTFSKILGIQNLDLSVNNLHSLPKGVFLGLSELRFLDLSSNDLSVIHKDDFTPLTSLHRLNLAKNKIEFIEDGSFSSLQELLILDLSANSIRTLCENSFPIKSLSLAEIYVDENPIKILPSFIFYVRGLKIASFERTHIAFENFTDYLLNMNMNRVLISVVKSASTPDHSDIYQQSNDPCLVKIGHSNITNLGFQIDQENITLNTSLQLVLLHFKLEFTANPIRCNCRINPIISFVNFLIKNNSIGNVQELFGSWICQSPKELYGKNILEIEMDQTLCALNVSNCPTPCKCYERTSTGNIIVDCIGFNLNNIPDNMPVGSLELRLSHNNITHVANTAYFGRVKIFDISHNHLKTIDSSVFQNLNKIETLNLRSNHLIRLPQTLVRLGAKSIMLSGNPYVCDCNVVWMKNWITSNKDIVTDWDMVTCNTLQNDGNIIVKVSKAKFVCKESSLNEFDEIKHAVLPSIATFVTVCLVIIAITLIYSFRTEIKVLMFIHWGLHPLDNDTGNNAEEIDCMVVHKSSDSDWVLEKVVKPLEHCNNNYTVVDSDRDFVVGYSFQQNVSNLVVRSKRMIIIVTGNSMPENVAMSWSIAQEKIKSTKSSFGIIVTHNIQKHNIEDKDMKAYLKHGRYVDSKELLFTNKLLYYMPGKCMNQEYLNTINASKGESDSGISFGGSIFNCTSTVSRAISNSSSLTIEYTESAELVSTCTTDLFITYHDTDMDFARHRLLSLFESYNYTVCFPDRDFLPGPSREENILNSIASSEHTVLVLSSMYIIDEWCLFTFRAAYEKSLRETSNHLIIVIRNDVDISNDIPDNEIQHYIKSYVCLEENHKWFENKLLHCVVYSHSLQSRGILPIQSLVTEL
ncbi:protein toll-like isoform X1 [Mya arenaria]|uniref:protein toll-like isoform X1 n=1 Tax=Mya arenaria TaxID=6604 RepID=UPI0022E019F0|nr:protein toll-like isoform X1 [Mya arenaria]